MNYTRPTGLQDVARILVVDDDPLICTLIQSLVGDNGHDVIVVHTALEMAHSLEREVVDCIFLDIDLPDGNGIEILESMRHYSNVPIIMITGSQSKDLRLKALECGADDYVMKPLDPRELLARMRNILRRSKVMSPDDAHLSKQNNNLSIAHR